MTAEGEPLLGYGRRMTTMNDDIFSQMTGQAYERALVLGGPHDTIYPGILWTLQFFCAEYPRMRLQVLSSWTLRLKELFVEGQRYIFLATEDHVDPNGETLVTKPMGWYGAPSGSAWS